MEPLNQNPRSENTPVFKEVIFYSRAAQARLGNFVEEKRDGAGRIERPEGSIRFQDHIYVTSDPKEIAFIRAHNAYESGDVVECETMKDARTLMEQRERLKYATDEERASFTESVIIEEGKARPVRRP